GARISAYQPPPGVISMTVCCGAMPKNARVAPGLRKLSRALLPARQEPSMAACSAASAARCRGGSAAGVSACTAGATSARATASMQVRGSALRVMAVSTSIGRASLARALRLAGGGGPWLVRGQRCAASWQVECVLTAGNSSHSAAHVHPGLAAGRQRCALAAVVGYLVAVGGLQFGGADPEHGALHRIVQIVAGADDGMEALATGGQHLGVGDLEHGLHIAEIGR